MQNQSASNDTGFVSHPMIRPGILEERTYQLEVARICATQNTLVMLPTGLGKTAIALLVVADSLSKDQSAHALILAPTRVLVHQHFAFISKYLNLDQEEIGVLTGEDTDEARESAWSKRVVCATPQVTVSDMQKKRCRLEDYSLIIFDEVHRAVGNHAYTLIASVYSEFNPGGRIVGMTASLPADRDKIEEIVSKLKITKVEIRDERNDEVKPYVFRTEVEWKEVELSPTLKSIQTLSRRALNARIKMLEDASLLRRNHYGSITLGDLLKLRAKVNQIHSSQLRSALFSGIRMFHALNLLETQSLTSFKNFMDRLMDRKRGYGMSELLNDQSVREAYEQARAALIAGAEHPKILEALNLVKGIRKGERAIIFASYRDTVIQIHSELIKHGFRAGYLIGKSGEGGQSQKMQIRALEELKDGVYDILVATQVGEEGLDVAECNTVVFYDNVPSAVRFVQRKGRTGRKSEGHLYVLITKGTRDEAYYWLSRRRVGDAKKITTALLESKQKKGPMDQYVQNAGSEDAPLVYADTREISGLVESIRQRGARVEVKQLDFGDFVVSSDIVIERKTLDDFVKSIYDGRLFKQLSDMNQKYARPILVIQGEKKHLSGIGESAFYGALASILADFKVPIFFASNEREVAELLFHIARREQIEKKRDARIREGRKPMSLSESQRYIVSGIPGVSGVLADRLLKEAETLENLFSTSQLDLQKIEGIGEVMAKRIRELSTAKYVSATIAEIKKIAARDSLENFTSTSMGKSGPSPTFSPDSREKEQKTEDEGLDIPPPAED